jgi:hypothetical protein
MPITPTDRHQRTALLVSLSLTIACGTNNQGASGNQFAQPTPQQDASVAIDASDSKTNNKVKRPVGWTDATHAKGVDPAYDLLFNEATVQRIDIVITAENYAAMLKNLEETYGKAGAGRSPGNKGGGPGDKPKPGPGGVPQDGLDACKGKSDNDKCTVEFGANKVNGECKPNSKAQGALFCFLEKGGAPQPGGNKGGGDKKGGGLDSLPEPIFVPVTIRHNGKTWTHVAMRFKGNSSLKFSWSQGKRKFPFRLNFDRYEDEHPEIDDQRFYGFKKMTFSSGLFDSSLVRERLAADILRDGGIPTARGTFCRVFGDTGEGSTYWGLYTMVEDPSNKMLDSQFEDDSGNLYKPEGQGATWGQFDQDSFEKKTNEDKADWSDIKAAIDALHASKSDPAAWRKGLEATLDVDIFLRALAINTAMVNWDAYGRMNHNYYIYADPKRDGRFVWIPWDMNEALFIREPTMSVLLKEIKSNWPLIRFLLDDPIYEAKYHDELKTALDGPLALDKINAKIQKYHALITPYVIGTYGEKAPYTLLSNDNEFKSALNGGKQALLTHVANRHKAVKAALANVGK